MDNENKSLNQSNSAKCYEGLQEKLQKKLQEKECKRVTKVAAHQEKRKNRLSEKNLRREQTNDYKLQKIKIRENHEKLKETISSKNHHFTWRSFFTKWFFLGFILVLVSLCISLISEWFKDNKLATTLLSIASGAFSSFGIALFVGCIFDFSKNSEAFMTFISKLLTDIIVSKTFLASLASDDKKEALKLILQPSNKQIEQYSNINEFFKKKIDDYMKMFDTNFKTNLILNIEARKDNDGKVYCISTLTYTIYKVRDEFEPIKLVLEKEGSQSSDVKIIHDKGETSIEPQTIIEGTEVSGGITQKTLIFDIPDELKSYEHLTIKRKMYEPGFGRWINYCWSSLTPYEGVICHVKCFDDLTIKDFMIFDNKAYYHTELSSDRTSLDITSSQWLEVDTGFYITISDDTMEMPTTL